MDPNKEKSNLLSIDLDRSKYEFKDADVLIFKTPKGLNEEIVKEISAQKKEPEWMLEYRLKSLKEFQEHHQPSFGPDLSFLNFQDYTYFTRLSDKVSKSWDEVPSTVRSTFDKLGIPEAEKDFLAGVSTQYESEAVYHNMLAEVQSKGVIFLDTDTALKTQSELFKKYFGTLVPFTDNKYAALNGACWSGALLSIFLKESIWISRFSLISASTMSAPGSLRGR